MIASEAQSINFEVDEVLKIKGMFFKVVLFDAFTSKVALKMISPDEAQHLEAIRNKKESN